LFCIIFISLFQHGNDLVLCKLRGLVKIQGNRTKLNRIHQSENIQSRFSGNQ